MLANWIKIRRLRRIAELENQLGFYTTYGDGPYGTSSQTRRDLQLELARLKAKLGISQATNWLIAPILQLYGI